MPQRRKRSAAITLVLAGSLGGCSEPAQQRDVYTSLDACQRDWNQAQQCEPVRDGRYSNTWVYGPPYYGASWPDGRPRSSANAIDAVRTERRTTTTSSSRGWLSSGTRSSSSTRSSSTSRGGFGSSGRSSIS